MDELQKERLRRLRTLFIDQSLDRRAELSYWRNKEDLLIYDRTLASRIRWKWQGVLSYIEDLGWNWPESLRLWDWGCGTGAASIAVVEGASAAIRHVYLSDRDHKAVHFAKEALHNIIGSQPCGISVTTPREPESTPLLLLVSHVVNELDELGQADLEKAVNASDLVLWVEPGSKESSQALVKLTERWRNPFYVLAPCPHQLPCPLLSEHRGKDWCHFFVKPPSWIFQDADWALFAKELGIDLRSLPVSFRFMVKKSFLDQHKSQLQVPEGGVSVGRPRIRKSGAQLWWCASDGTFTECQINKKDPRFRKAKKYHL